jgi:hypothetical protein
MFTKLLLSPRLPAVRRVERFHSRKGQFANVVFLAMAIGTLALLAFNYWGSEAHEGASPAHAAGVPSLPAPFRGPVDPPTHG